MSETLKVDVVAYARGVEEQRNAALNQAAQLQAAVDQLLAEREELRRQLADAKGEPAAA